MSERRDTRRRAPRAQGGWMGFVALLVALAIVAWLAQSALRSHGVASRPAAPVAPGVPPSDPRERAKAVEQTVIEQARDTARRIEDAE